MIRASVLPATMAVSSICTPSGPPAPTYPPCGAACREVMLRITLLAAGFVIGEQL